MSPPSPVVRLRAGGRGLGSASPANVTTDGNVIPALMGGGSRTCERHRMLGRDRFMTDH